MLPLQGAASNKAGHDSVMMTPRPQDEAVRHLQLAAVGGLIDVNPDRVVLKRVVLSGYPYKVHKRRATVRWMFFNPEVCALVTPARRRSAHLTPGLFCAMRRTYGGSNLWSYGQSTAAVDA